MSRLRVLFLSTGNACRSQMAEAWARQMASDSIDARSAGIEAQGLNEIAVAVMEEVGIDMSSQVPARVNAEILEWADLIVTLCDNVDEQCPIVNIETLKLHLPLSNPAKIKGDAATVLAAFRETRDAVKERVDYVLEEFSVCAA